MCFRVITSVFVYCALISSNIHCNGNGTPADGNFNAQEDAKTIFNAQDRNQAYLDILANRDFKQCEQIDAEFAKLNNGHPIIADDYVPQTGTSLDDLLFALIKGPQRTKLAYLYSMLEQPLPPRRSNPQIIMRILILDDKNKKKLIDDYNSRYKRPINEAVGLNAKHDFKNFLVEMVTRTREEKYNGPSQEEADAVNLLNEERKKKASWGDHRQQLDLVLWQKPREFVVEVLKKYAESNSNHTLHFDIWKKFGGKNMKANKQHMSFGYSSIINFLKDPIEFSAFCLHVSVRDDEDFDATLILIIVCFSENGLKDVNEIFQKKNEKSIKDFLLEGENPSITRKILSVIADKKVQIGSPNAAPPTQPPPATTSPSPAS